MSQHMDALQLANERRMERARLKREIQQLPPAEAWARAADILADPPASLSSLLLTDYLMWQHRFGKHMTGRFMLSLRARQGDRGLPISEFKTVGSMTLRQLLMVSGAMREYGDDLRMRSAA
jgi:hypothetical protein